MNYSKECICGNTIYYDPEFQKFCDDSSCTQPHNCPCKVRRNISKRVEVLELQISNQFNASAKMEKELEIVKKEIQEIKKRTVLL